MADPANGARWRYGTYVVFGGLVAVLIALLITVFYFEDVSPAKDAATVIATILGPITTVIGTVVGAYFGLQVGQAGTEKAEERAEKAEEAKTKLAAVVPEDKANAILQSL